MLSTVGPSIIPANISPIIAGCLNLSKISPRNFAKTKSNNRLVKSGNSKYETDESPIDEHCDCPVCRNFSRAYIRHLLKSGEMLGMRLAVLHNLYFYNNLMEVIRTQLDNGTYMEIYEKYRNILGVRI